MSPLPRISAVLFYISTVAWVYLYLYPIWQGCGFPMTQLKSEPQHPPTQFPFFQHNASREAPFRLLVLADPQLEGDTSLPDLKFSVAQLSPAELLSTSKQTFKYLRKKLDLWGNDRYLAHIYRSLQTFTDPTHVTVLGDLLGSQWISDEEFDRRADRFWDVVFAESDSVPEYLTRQPLQEVLGTDTAWRKRIISIAGNHDIGYAGDMTEERMARFERRFGRANWEVAFELPSRSTKDSDSAAEGAVPAKELNGAEKSERPSIRVLILNSMNLDSPAYAKKLQEDTYSALNGFMSRSKSVEDSEDTLTIVLTHVPLFKRDGVCVDAPFFNYHSPGEGGGIKEQNHLSDHSSRLLLEGVYGMSDESEGRRGLILNGHDHEGCDTWHFLPTAESTSELDEYKDHRWNATKWRGRQRIPQTSDVAGIREVTLRAMMGEYGGNAAFVSAWYDEQAGHWSYGVSQCAIGSQHIWWAVHVLFIVTAFVGSAGLFEWQAASIKERSARRMKARAERKEAKKSSVRRK